jgi:hypothetical protein
VREVFSSFFFERHDEDPMAIDSLVYPQNPSCPIWT